MKLPRLRFSLRTMLIAVALLAIPCAYVAHEAQIVRHRKALITRIRAAGGWVVAIEDDPSKFKFGPAQVPPDLQSVPRIRHWLGDEAIGVIFFPAELKHDEDEIRAAFPEASFGQFLRPANLPH